MKLDFIPFQIGMHYENWEFDLEPIEGSWDHDKYLYIGNDIKEVLNEEVDKVYLYFKWDILYEVIFLFKASSTIQQFINLLEALEKYLGETSINSNPNISTLEVEWKEEELLIKLSLEVDVTLVVLKISASS